MPMKKGSKKTSMKKRGTTWLTKYQPRALAINRQAPGLGRSLKTRLETTFFYNATAAASGVFTGYLNPGSCFDPCGSFSAIQPVGFDQLKALYARYLVTGGYVDIEFVDTYQCTAVGSQYSGVWAVAAYPSTVSTAASTYQGAASQPYSKEFLIGPQMTKKIRISFDTQKIIGSRLPVVAEDAGALISADPTIGQNVVVPIFAQHSTSFAATCCFRFKIVQDVIFDQRIQVVDV